MDRGRADRPGARGPRVDQPPGGILAPGGAPPHDGTDHQHGMGTGPAQPDARLGHGRAAASPRGALAPPPRPGGARRGAPPRAEGLRWDLSLGPVADDIPYHPIYHPFNWRGWVDFGVGALGDMGAHLIDHPFWALGLTHPTRIEATSTQWGVVPIPADPSAPAGSREARGYNKPVSYPV